MFKLLNMFISSARHIEGPSKHRSKCLVSAKMSSIWYIYAHVVSICRGYSLRSGK